MQALVLDLRNNPGGLLNSAVDVCAQFLPPGTKVVSTQGRTSSQQHDYATSITSKERPHFPLAVLVNEGSASGSEIVSGALKDLHRAILVGETTFGKGSVQNVMQLPDGSALRFTTAKYYTPSKQVIHGNGVTPNIRVPMTRGTGAIALLHAQRGQCEARGRKDRDQDEGSANDARDRCAQRRHDLRGADCADKRAGEEVVGFSVIPSEVEDLLLLISDAENNFSERCLDFARHDNPGDRNFVRRNRGRNFARRRNLLASEVASQIKRARTLRRRRSGSRLAKSSRPCAASSRARVDDARDFVRRNRRLCRDERSGLASSLMIGASIAKGLRSVRETISRDQSSRGSSALAIFRRRSVEPNVSLVVSGGHTLLVEVRGVNDYRHAGTNGR